MEDSQRKQTESSAATIKDLNEKIECLQVQDAMRKCFRCHSSAKTLLIQREIYNCFPFFFQMEIHTLRNASTLSNPRTHNRSLTNDLNQIDIHEDEMVDYTTTPQVNRQPIRFPNFNLSDKFSYQRQKTQYRFLSSIVID